MDFLIDFYKSLDMLNLIIFWGIIVVIILLLIFSFILINKNKKLKYLIDTNTKEEDIPIKTEDTENENSLEELPPEENKSVDLPPIPEIPKEQEIVTRPIETEKKFVAEEHVMEYNNDLFSLSNIKKATETNEEKTNHEINYKSKVEIPTKPYQKNVLREMSLSQTSPIGLTSPIKKEDKKIEMAKDLEKSLSNESKKEQEINEEYLEITEQLKKDLNNLENLSPRKTEINDNIKNEKIERNNRFNNNEKNVEVESKLALSDITNTSDINKQSETLFNDIIEPIEKNKSSNENYLEEVSRKLAEAEVPDEIERTDYELEQEENAIISYKELMAKKDSIETVDEEDAVISIEELMNRSNQNQENTKEIKEETKLYNLIEEEENDNFIKELKQFRNDL